MNLNLYKNIPLNDSYQDVYGNYAAFRANHTPDLVATIYNCDFYLKNEGDITLELPGFFEVPNYMTAPFDTEDEKQWARFFFITNFEVYNDTVRIHYKLDVWMTYMIRESGFNPDVYIRHGHRCLASVVVGDRGEFITPPHYGSQVDIESVNLYPEATGNRFIVMYTGYMYTGVKDKSDDVSTATPFFGYVTEAKYPSKGAETDGVTYVVDEALEDIHAQIFTSYVDACNAATKVFQYASAAKFKIDVVTGNGNTCYCQITRCFIFPAACFYPLATGATPDNFDFIGYFDSTYFDAISILDYTGDPDSGYTISFLSFQKGITSGKSIRYAYSKAINLNSFETVTTVRQKIGTLQHQIDIPYAVWNTDNEIGLYSLYTLTGFTILLYTFGQIIDITDDFEYTLNYTPESALTAVQRKNLAKQDTVNMTGALIGSGVSVGVAAATGNAAGIATGLTSGITTIAGYALNRQQEYSEIHNSPSYTDIGTQYYGICLLYAPIKNANDIQREYESYGLAVDYVEDEITLDDTISYNVVAYSDVQILGNIPSQYKDTIRQILLNGTRIWNSMNKIDDDRDDLTLHKITDL